MAMMDIDSIAIIPSATLKLRNRDCEYRFRQDSDFYYLSGLSEPDAVMVLVPGRRHGEVLFFCRERDADRERWEGPRIGPEGACERFGADDAFPISDIDDILPGLIEGRERVYYAMGKQADFDSRVMRWVTAIRGKRSIGAHPPGEFLDLDHLLHELRLFKSAAEQRLMRKAAEISASAHLRAMRFCKPGITEHRLEVEILHEFGVQGARTAAYNAIIGAGPNSCVLHYVDNSRRIRDRDLVLIDAGCEYENYASDLTRTFPANGRFTAEQRALYEIVYAAQLQAIKAVRPGNHWNQPHESAIRIICQGLVDLGLLDGELDELIELEAYRPFCMHRIGHWLGLDVHDVGDYKVGGRWRQFEAGMVLTVEPGIYVAPENLTVAKKWRGLGIRIEDDVLVTQKGRQILSASVPKRPNEIEKVMRARN